jgi:hypothetical protein
MNVHAWWKSINLYQHFHELIIIHLLKILAFVATITAKNYYHDTNQKRDNRFLNNQKAAVIILAQKLPLEFLVNTQ